MSYFRPEVEAHRRTRLEGAVVLTNERWSRAVVGGLGLAMAAAAAWVMEGWYTPTAVMPGILEQEGAGSARLVAAIYAPAEIISVVKPGEEVRITLGEGNGSSSGALRGSIIGRSPSMVDPSGSNDRALYRIDAAIEQHRASLRLGGVTLAPGIRVRAEIQLGRQRVKGLLIRGNRER